MAIVAPISKYKKNTLKIIIAVLIGLAIYCFYDGYYNQKFIEKNTVEGTPNSTLTFNRKAPPFMFGAAVLVGIRLFLIRNKKVTADDQAIVTCAQTIAYDSIEQIDKTHFDSKGYFVVTYKNEQGDNSQLKLSDRTYDNLPAVLDVLISKIS